MRIIFIGDIVGRPGRQAVREYLPRLRSRYPADLVIANAENAAGGVGVTRDVVDELVGLGVDVLTTGNHVWDKKEALGVVDEEPRLLRPNNYPPGTPGRGYLLATASNGVKVGVINVAGRVFFPVHYDCPFRSAGAAVDELLAQTRVVVVDVHAEATSEKVAMGWFLDGRVSAVVGTHTHVQTFDGRVLPGGSAYLGDVGMTGPSDSVIGIRRELVLERFTTQLPVRFEVATGRKLLCAAAIDVNPVTGRAERLTVVTMGEGMERVYSAESESGSQ